MSSDKVFQVEMLPVRHGDSLLVTYGPVDDVAQILIDGGPNDCYATLAGRLKRVSHLELMVVTHIDNDHIGGIIRLLMDEELRISYNDLWFNGWNQLRKPLSGWASANRTGPASRSPLEGNYLECVLRTAGNSWNGTFRGMAACVAEEGQLPVVELRHGLKLTLLSPDVKSLRKLRTNWKRALTRLRLEPEQYRDVEKRLEADRRYRGGGEGLPACLDELAVTLDQSVANGSSIAFVAEYEGRRCAFLGDAHMPLIQSSIRRLAKQYGERRLRLDAVKVSHHGSAGNLTTGFLKEIVCNDFLISTDGSLFGHPDDEAINMLLACGTKPVRLHFNYATKRNERWYHSAVYPGRADNGITLSLI